METAEKKKPGRKPGKTHPFQKVVQFTEAEAALLQERAESETGGNQSEYLRRAFHKAAREGL